jgi:hypothetical protein
MTHLSFRHFLLLVLCAVLPVFAQVDSKQGKIIDQAAYDLGTLCRKNFAVQVKSEQLSSALSMLISKKAAEATGLPVMLTIDSYNLQNNGNGTYTCKIALAANTPQKQQLEQMANTQLAGTKFAQALGMLAFWPLQTFASTCVDKRENLKVVKYSNTHFIFNLTGLNVPGPGGIRIKSARYKLNRNTNRLDALIFDTADGTQLKFSYHYAGEAKEPAKISVSHNMKGSTINGIPVPPSCTFTLDNYTFK